MARGTVVQEYLAPDDGARSDLAPHRLPNTAVPADVTQNVIVRDGVMVNRPGFAQITATKLQNRPMGGILFQTGSSRFTVLGTLTTLEKLNAAHTGYDNLTGPTPPSGMEYDPFQFAVFPTTLNNLIAVNKGSVPQTWDGTGTFVDLTATDLRAADVTVAANRVVLADTIESGVGYQYRVRWSGFNDHTTYAPLDFADLSDTPDIMVGARALSRVAFAVYKEHSQWVGLAQTGLYPFKFELQDLKPGPVGPAAIVVADGRHYYLAHDGSIYVFDGIRTTHVGDPIRRFLLNTFNFENERRCFGYYSRRDRNIYWWFCSAGSDDPDIGISMQIDSGRFFPHAFRKSASCGFEVDFIPTVTWDSLGAYTWDNVAATYPTWASFGSLAIPAEVVGGVDGTVHQFGVAATDDGLSPSAQWRIANRQIGRQMTWNAANVNLRARIESLDSFFAVASAAQTVTVKVGTTDTLGTAPSFPSELTTTIDIGSADALRQGAFATTTPGYGTGTAEARYHSIQYEIDTVTDWAWEGCHVHSYTQQTSSP